MLRWSVYGPVEDVHGTVSYDAESQRAREGLNPESFVKANEHYDAAALEEQKKAMLERAAARAEDLKEYEKDHSHHNRLDSDEREDATSFRGENEFMRGMKAPMATPQSIIPQATPFAGFRPPSAATLASIAAQMVAFKRPGVFDEEELEEALRETPRVRKRIVRRRPSRNN
jgi:hypothetical protein